MNWNVLTEALFLACLYKWNCFSLEMPSENDLSRWFVLWFSDIFYHCICKNIHIFNLMSSVLELSGSNWAIWWKVNSPLLVDFVHSSLLEIWMTFYLVDSWANFTVSKDITKDWECTIAHTDALYETFLYKGFHLLPNHMIRWRLDLPIVFPVNLWLHPVYEI